jgi:hypothetical protein
VRRRKGSEDRRALGRRRSPPDVLRTWMVKGQAARRE